MKYASGAIYQMAASETDARRANLGRLRFLLGFGVSRGSENVETPVAD